VRQKLSGKIRWFDAMAGNGVVRLEDGRSVPLHFTAIVGIERNNHHWPTESDKLILAEIDNMDCKVTLCDGQVDWCCMSGASKNKFAELIVKAGC